MNNESIQPIKFEFPVPFKIDAENIHLVLSGVGGNGAHFAHQALRVIKDHMDKGLRNYRISFIDGDVVEPKNLLRQNFYQSDIGKNKAETTANRYSKAFSLPIGVYSKFVEDVNTLKSLMFIPNYVTILVTCFDNHKSRKMVQQVFEENIPFVWLDLGNDEFTGQVVCSYNGPNHLKEGELKGYDFFLPSVVQLFPEIARSNDLFKSEESCAEHAVANVQNISANVVCSTLAFTMFNQIISADGLLTHCVKFDSRTAETHAMKIKYSTIKDYK